MNRHYHTRSLDPTAAQAERDRTARLVSAERRLNEALRHLEELLRLRREPDQLPTVDSIPRP